MLVVRLLLLDGGGGGVRVKEGEIAQGEQKGKTRVY